MVSAMPIKPEPVPVFASQCMLHAFGQDNALDLYVHSLGRN